VRLKYIHRYTDRHGHVRHYLRRHGEKKVPLPGAPGSPEFIAAYQQAMANPTQVPVKALATPGSVNAASIAWYASSGFTGLRASTQIVYRRILDGFRADYGTKPLALLHPQHIEAIVEKRAATPAAANHLLRVLRLMMRHAVAKKMLKADPTRDVARLKLRNQGIYSWTDAEIEQFEGRWPIGSKPRLAFELLLYTAQRRSDVVRMGRQHLRPGGLIYVRQVKTGKELEIPIHSYLQACIDAVPADNMTFLLTYAGRPFTPNGFYNAFTRWVEAAGLPAGRSPHGLRKAQARRLAEAGCSAHEIASITGHETLAEVQRYTKAADQRRMATSAMARVGRSKGRTG
jgi:integrase